MSRRNGPSSVLPGSVIAGRDELWEGFGEDDGLVASPTWLRHRWTWRALRRIWWRWRTRCSSPWGWTPRPCPRTAHTLVPTRRECVEQDIGIGPSNLFFLSSYSAPIPSPLAIMVPFLHLSLDFLLFVRQVPGTVCLCKLISQIRWKRKKRKKHRAPPIPIYSRKVLRIAQFFILSPVVLKRLVAWDDFLRLFYPTLSRNLSKNFFSYDCHGLWFSCSFVPVTMSHLRHWIIAPLKSSATLPTLSVLSSTPNEKKNLQTKS